MWSWSVVSELGTREFLLGLRGPTGVHSPSQDAVTYPTPGGSSCILKLTLLQVSRSSSGVFSPSVSLLPGSSSLPPALKSLHGCLLIRMHSFSKPCSPLPTFSTILCQYNVPVINLAPQSLEGAKHFTKLEVFSHSLVMCNTRSAIIYLLYDPALPSSIDGPGSSSERKR